MLQQLTDLASHILPINLTGVIFGPAKLDVKGEAIHYNT